jgi:hypothetical protein
VTTAQAGWSRRALLGAAATVGTVAAAGCTHGDGAPTAAGATPSSPQPTPSVATTRPTGDLLIVALAAALENAAVFVYDSAIAAASSGRLATLPPALVSYVTTARRQHEEHAAAWNAFLGSHGHAGVPDLPLRESTSLRQRVAAVRKVTDLTTLALELERRIVSTYLQAAQDLSLQPGIKTAMAIAPVEAGHVAILSFLAGRSPVEETLWQPTDALGVTSYIG